MKYTDLNLASGHFGLKRSLIQDLQPVNAKRCPPPQIREREIQFM